MTSAAEEPTASGSTTAVDSLTRRLARWTAGLRLDDVPERVIPVAVSQVISHLATVRASVAHPMGRRLLTAFGQPDPADPARTAHLLAALSSCLYLEDTMYAGHVAHAGVGVPVAHQERQRLDGRGLLAAVIAANESAARVTAAATLGPFRGQQASHTHLVAAVAARLHGAGADHDALLNAWGLALAAPPLWLRPSFLGSDAKVLSAAVPVRIAMDACDAAAAGLTGRDDLLEHPDGVLAKFAHAPVPEAVVAGLGERWHTETLSFKLFPGAVHLDALVECAAELHRRLRPRGADDVEAVEMHVPRMTMVMSRHAGRYTCGPDSPLVAVNMWAGYNVATALLTGGLGVADLAEPLVRDPDRWALAGKLTMIPDETLSQEGIAGTAPVGEALRQAGPRALDWRTELPGKPLEQLLEELGPPSPTFEHATKKLGCRMVVRMADGRRDSYAMDAGTGSVGSPSWSAHPELVRDKLLATGADKETARTLARLPELSVDELSRVLRQVLTW